MPRSTRLRLRAAGLAALVLVSPAVGAPDAAEQGPAWLEPPAPGEATPSVVLAPEAVRRVGIETIVVEPRSAERARTLGGEVVVAGGGEIVLSAPMAGVVLGAPDGGFPRPGATVERGQPLLQLLALPPDRDLFAAREEVERAQARFDLASSQARRTERLLQAGAGSVRGVEQARADLADAGAALTAARARLNLLNGTDLESVAATIAPLVLSAPGAGVLRAVHVAPHQSVAAATPLLELIRPDPLWVRVPVYAGDAEIFDLARGARVRPLSALATDAGREARQVESPPAADPLAASVDLVFEVPNPDLSLRPGQRVHVTLALRERRESLRVPAAAVLYDAEGGTWVYEQRGERSYVRRRVEVAAAVDRDAVVTRGLAPGTRIVVVGAAELFGVEFQSGGAAAGHEDDD